MAKIEKIFVGNRTIFAVTEAVNIVKLSMEAIPSMTVQLAAIITKVLCLQMADSLILHAVIVIQVDV